jgi:hypothetical protein
MSRPARKISGIVLRSLIARPKLRYTLTKKGSRAVEAGGSPAPDLLDSLIAAIQANNKQPVSLATWRKFHAPKRVPNDALRLLVTGRFISIVSRGKFSFAVE